MKRRVLHVIDHTGSGGAQVLVRDIIRALMERFCFGVAVLGRSAQFSAVYKSLGIPVFELGSRGGRWDPSPTAGLMQVIRRQGYDLIHTHLFKSHILGTIADRLTGRKIILHDHTGIYPQSLEHHLSNRLLRYGYLFAYRHVIEYSDRIIVLTPEIMQQYAQFYSIDPRRITVLPNAVDVHQFDRADGRHPSVSLRKALGLSAETRLIMMLGRLDPVKDWMTFLQVAEQVQKRSNCPCGFLIVGSGPEERRLRDYARTHKLARTFFLGYRDDVPSLLQQADVVLLTSRRESFGIALLEAMAAGCPVVATRSGGPESILTDGVDGLLAEVGDVRGLSNQVMRLLDDRALGERLARHARQTVAHRYSLEAVAARLTDIYEEVLAQ